MKKEAEAAEFWLGKEDENSLKRSRSFVDRLSALTDLCIFKENRVIDLGNKKEEKKKPSKNSKSQSFDDDEDFEFLNLSEFNDQWDDEDKRVCNDYEIVDE